MEDYIKGGFSDSDKYSNYEGAKFSDLLKRQRELPFGNKLQNHALNHRLNEEFKKFFPACENLPIIRDAERNRYWINEQLIALLVDNNEVNLAESVKEVIEVYINARKASFCKFMTYCQEIISIQKESPDKAIQFIKDLFRPNVDARIFEIASFAVLRRSKNILGMVSRRTH